MRHDLYQEIPTWDNGVWTTTSFSTRDDFKRFILSIFKIPGKYNFDSTTTKLFREQAFNFEKNKVYCTAPFKSKDFILYWDGEKEKSRKGVIVKNKDNIFYLTRDYYMWLNYLPIYDKEEKIFNFPKIRDAQYHMALYECLSELYYKHASVLKKRQFGSSYYHMSKLLNQLWFEEGVVLKIGASLKDYINEKGSWKFLNEYAAFLNEHTAWYRPMSPDKVMMWQQKIEIKKGDRKAEIGLKGTIQGMSFEKDPTNGVGGPVQYFFHEEAGIAPKMDKTYEYIRPALRAGMITTGMFIAAGTVGDLDQCEPLKEFTLNPERNDIFYVETDLIDDKGTIGKSALFIPEQWAMPPYIDEYGNSLVEEALEALNNQFAIWKKELTPEQYQLRISQHPRNIKEAFDYRTVSKFPTHLISHQMKRIEEGNYPYEKVDLIRTPEGEIKTIRAKKEPIKTFPVDKKLTDKEGCIQIWERPIKNPKLGVHYFASVDPVGVGKTTSSESLCSIYIMKANTEVTKIENGNAETYIEHAKIVACWTGRFDDLNKTHERLEMMLEYYNAWCVVENNISQFILYMIQKRKQRYLVPKSQIAFLKELSANAQVFQEYGWKNTGRLFKDHLINYAIDFTKENIHEDLSTTGEVVRVTYGIERIPDALLLTEMLQYQDDINVDRLVAFTALVSFMKIQDSNRGYVKRVDKVETPEDLEMSKNLYKLNKNPFSNFGGKSNSSQPFRKNPFRNLK